MDWTGGKETGIGLRERKLYRAELYLVGVNSVGMIAKTPEPPYYAVIFTSLRTSGDNGYAKMADRMIELAEKQPGYLGVESVRDNLGITISYWKDEESIKAWKENLAHTLARKKGRETWYNSFTVRVARVERDYSFDISADSSRKK